VREGAHQKLSMEKVHDAIRKAVNRLSLSQLCRHILSSQEASRRKRGRDGQWRYGLRDALKGNQEKVKEREREISKLERRGSASQQEKNF
jgi:hypothetical protein